MTHTRTPLISVVIPAYNEASYIGRLLAALALQDAPEFEVIVSDAASNDGTVNVVRQYADILNLHIVESAQLKPGANRNAGAKHARGEWLLFLDADNDLKDRTFIRTLVTHATQHGWQTASTRMRPINGNHMERFAMAVDYLYIACLAHTKHPVAPGWCILTKRTLFERYGGFNEQIHLGEDYDYVSRVGRVGGFGFVTQTEYLMDLRRLHNERWRFVINILSNELYRQTHKKNLEHNPHTYNYGKHPPREDKTR